MTELSLSPVVYDITLLEEINTVELSAVGTQGPAGQTGGTYTHEQGTPSATWTMDHNLGYNPGGIIVLDSAGTVVEGSYEFPNVNRIIATFTSGFSGNAYLS
jgi:hypothetical protein